MNKNIIINHLFKCKEIKDFCINNNLQEDDVIKYFGVFSAYEEQINKCSNCNLQCDGHKMQINYIDNEIVSSYYTCEKTKKLDPKNFEVIGYTEKEEEIYTNATRAKLFDKFAQFSDNYFQNKKAKGVYISGNCGTGKSFLMYRFSQTLVKNGAKVLFVYYPDLVRLLQTNFGSVENENLIVKLKKADILVIDDIGREANTQYVRDSILGPILQYRVNNDLPLFMTSNRSFEKLKEHLALANIVDDTKAIAIINRLKYMMDEFVLTGKDYRNS